MGVDRSLFCRLEKLHNRPTSCSLVIAVLCCAVLCEHDCYYYRLFTITTCYLCYNFIVSFSKPSRLSDSFQTKYLAAAEFLFRTGVSLIMYLRDAFHLILRNVVRQLQSEIKQI